MPNPHNTVTVALSEATQEQLIRHISRTIYEGFTTMSQQITDLQNAVNKELADDAAQNQLIATLNDQIATAKASLDAAVAGEADAKQQLADALDAMSNATTQLGSNDAPAEPTPAPEVPAEPVPAEPTPAPEVPVV